MDKLFYNSNVNAINKNDDNSNNKSNNNFQQNNQLNHFGSIADDTPAILLEQLAYIDTFMPQLEEDIVLNQNNNNNAFVQHNNNDMNFLNNNNNNNFDFISNSLDDRLAEELKIFADESFIFPDEDKPENPDGVSNGTNSFTPNGMPNYNNNSVGPGLLGDNSQKQNKKDLRNKYLKTNIGNDDNKAFLKRHDYSSNNNEIIHTGYTPSVNSIHSTHTNVFQQSPEFTNPTVSSIEPQQTVSLSEYHTSSLYTMLPRIQHDRYIKILSDLQKLQNQEDFVSEWTLNFSLEEVALLLVFKEYYLPELPVSLIQYDQFQDPEVIEREMYKVLNMQIADDNQGNTNGHVIENEYISKSGAVKRKSSVLDTGSSGTEESSKTRKPSLVEEDLETQVKKLIKISEKLQKKVTSLEVENKMLKNLVSKDNNS